MLNSSQNKSNNTALFSMFVFQYSLGEAENQVLVQSVYSAAI